MPILARRRPLNGDTPTPTVDFPGKNLEVGPDLAEDPQMSSEPLLERLRVADGVHVVAAAPSRAGDGAPQQTRDTVVLLFTTVVSSLGEPVGGAHIIILGEPEDVTIAGVLPKQAVRSAAELD